MRILIKTVLVVLLLSIGAVVRTVLDFSGNSFLGFICLVASICAAGGVLFFKKKKTDDSRFSIDTESSTTKKD